MVEEAWKVDIEAQDHQRPLADTPVGLPSVCQLPTGLSVKINTQI